MSLAELAGLLADRTRATICVALLDGRAWTAGELAKLAKVAPSTASGHLSRLIAGGILAEERQGRHRYVRLAGPEVAALIEDLSSFGAPPPARSLRESNRRRAEARARTCYDHLAGHLGVAVADAMVRDGLVADDAGLAVTPAGVAWLDRLGIAPAPARGRRPLVRSCLDWTERRTHLAGTVGAALCAAALDRHWVERAGGGRALRITPAGTTAFRTHLNIELP
ncbi:winged helix-turn-helix domain-containing protein [Longispora sp. NPDC051575]|uniref:ArsR/SmtB family transcription factor n=1 Tax=Longispora sp. NPDC051575 TaxID=3154943 RepID=UPI00341F76A6